MCMSQHVDRTTSGIHCVAEVCTGEGKARMGLWLVMWGRGRCEWASGCVCGGGEGTNGPLVGHVGEGKA